MSVCNNLISHQHNETRMTQRDLFKINYALSATDYALKLILSLRGCRQREYRLCE